MPEMLSLSPSLCELRCCIQAERDAAAAALEEVAELRRQMQVQADALSAMEAARAAEAGTTES